MTRLLPLAALLAALPAAAAEPWATYRGTAARAGNTDGVAGPAAPRVLWAFKSADHFVAAPVPAGDALIVSGLGAFNVATLHALPLAGSGTVTPVWSKSTPYLKLPTVSSPAVAGGRLVFGDGMHQTNGAALHALTAAGKPLWQLAVPGQLVHLEGSPTVAGGRAVIGGGAAGVLCVDAARLSLDGKELDAPAIEAALAARWKELQDKYAADLKRDPDFAVKPTEDALPRPAPRVVWRQGQGRWHVDAPVALVGDAVLAASAFLDKEGVGERAVFCLNAADGSVKWRAALKLNPWGGPSVAGETVVLGGSTIGYYPDQLKGAKGDVTALDLATGREKWRKEVPGGVVGSVAVAGGVAVATATDGKVRAFDLAAGDRRWVYDAKFPLFAAPAVVAGVAYAADLRGVLHAIDLTTGAAKWTLDLGADPAVGAPGMVYGGPVVHGGKVYVATCNLAGPHANKPTAVVCVGQK